WGGGWTTASPNTVSAGPWPCCWPVWRWVVSTRGTGSNANERVQRWQSRTTRRSDVSVVGIGCWRGPGDVSLWRALVHRASGGARTSSGPEVGGQLRGEVRGDRPGVLVPGAVASPRVAGCAGWHAAGAGPDPSACPAPRPGGRLNMDLSPDDIVILNLGPVALNATVVVTWILMV